MIDPKVLLVEFLKSNYSSANPTLTQMSGRIFTAPTERPFMVPSIVVGPVPETPGPWLSQFEHWYKIIVPVTAYAAYDLNPLTKGTTEQDAKIQRWNMIDAVRNLIDYNKNLSGSPVQVAHNDGWPREVNLTKWRPGVLALVQNVIVEVVDDISNRGSLP